MSEKFDHIVVGEGFGGVACAVILRKIFKKKVALVFDNGGNKGRYDKNDKMVWLQDYGIYSFGEVEYGTRLREIIDFVTGKRMKWEKYPSKYEKVFFPNFSYEFNELFEYHKEDLIKTFPEEEQNILKYFDEMEQIANFSSLVILDQILPAYITFPLKVISRKKFKSTGLTIQEYFDKRFENLKLKAILASRWENCGAMPQECSLIVHSIFIYHFLAGAHYPVNGVKELLSQMFREFVAAGGVLFTNHRLEEIIVNRGKATGVKISSSDNGETETNELQAASVISDAGAVNTYRNLLKEGVPAKMLREVDEFKPQGVLFRIKFEMKSSPAKIGATGADLRVYNTFSFITRNKMTADYGEKPELSYLVSFDSLKDPSRKDNRVEVVSFMDKILFDFFNAHYNTEEKLTTLVKKIINDIDSKLPGFRNLIKDYTIVRPTEATINDSRITTLGVPPIPARYKQKWLKIKTPVKNLYLTGQDIYCPGIPGAFLGAVATAGALNGKFGFFKLLGKIKKAIYPEKR